MFLSETWLKENDIIHLEGFQKVIHVSRSKNIGTRNEGGIAVFCKNFLYEGIMVEKEINYGILLLKLDHNFFAADRDVYICFSYIWCFQHR